MKLLTAFGLSAVALVCLQARADDAKAKGDPAKLVGTYAITSGERDGEAIAAGRLKEVAVRIAANAITTFDKDNKEVYVATYKLDTATKPWQIVMTATVTPVNGKGEKARGLIEARGDTVRLIYALPGGKEPTEFKTKQKQQMFVLTRTGS